MSGEMTAWCFNLYIAEPACQVGLTVAFQRSTEPWNIPGWMGLIRIFEFNPWLKTAPPKNQTICPRTALGESLPQLEGTLKGLLL